MSEIGLGGIPIPIINYVELIRNRKSPYYDIVQFLLKEMEFHLAKDGCSEISYVINPRILQEEIEKRVKNKKLTTVNVCRTIRAACLTLSREGKLKKAISFSQLLAAEHAIILK